MKAFLAVIAATALIFLAGNIGLATGRERGYRDGWLDGYTTPHPVTPEAKVVGNLLCRYAEVACPELELKARYAKPH